MAVVVRAQVVPQKPQTPDPEVVKDTPCIFIEASKNRIASHHVWPNFRERYNRAGV